MSQSAYFLMQLNNVNATKYSDTKDRFAGRKNNKIVYFAKIYELNITK